MIFEMLRWWYVTGWLQAARRIGGWTSAVEHTFSLSLLVSTLFAPWRRIVSAKGRGLDDKIRAAIDNFVSRCVGFVIRFFVILAALFGMLIAFIMSACMTVIWPLLPLLIVFFIFKGIVG